GSLDPCRPGRPLIAQGQRGARNGWGELESTGCPIRGRKIGRGLLADPPAQAGVQSDLRCLEIEAEAVAAARSSRDRLREKLRSGSLDPCRPGRPLIAQGQRGARNGWGELESTGCPIRGRKIGRGLLADPPAQAGVQSDLRCLEIEAEAVAAARSSRDRLREKL